MGKFVKFLGRCALNGKQIAVYENGGGSFRLSAETVGGKPVFYSYRDERGRSHTVAVRDMELSADEFDSFEDRVSAGVVGRSDARIVQRGLIEMGYPESME
ncbi:hypothetical protein [Pseudothauera rhizosphaerae]|uniref:Uncharacterized protein n=1 Tax=Pseudothauera rhizosphaerae TaxID=2565932 RepID=A0A4S4ACN2_9RHOO|nr:hypothetical protein [Pseudothauera rhizosphaerae]THF55930.1 hypothetical protein E6O51_20300 [Pseudothauera rhizosphaerae]